MVKMWSNNGQTNYSRILVLLNNYFIFLNFCQIWSNCGQTMVKLLIQEILLLLHNYSRILVLLNNYFSFFEFWSTLVKLWSNNGQTIIQEILVLLNNYFIFFLFWSNLVKLWSNLVRLWSNCGSNLLFKKY